MARLSSQNILHIACVIMVVFIVYKIPHQITRQAHSRKEAANLGQVTSYSIQTKYVAQLSPRAPAYTHFEQALRDNVSPHNQIFLALVDMAFVDMAINMWETSFAPLEMTNLLFVCSIQGAYDILHELGVPAYLHVDDAAGASASGFGSQTFNKKTHLKTKMVLQALQFGFNVILTDVDIVYFKNPIYYFSCADCDLEIQDDSKGPNSGFFYIRNTTSAISLLEQTLQREADTQNRENDQQAITVILNQMAAKKTIKFNMLNKEDFPNGWEYWNKKRLWLPDNKTNYTPVLVHNNYILHSESKIYRFKEFSMWATDKNGYYSSPTRKYITYDNIEPSEGHIQSNELVSLKEALAIAHILNRTVILPKFHCILRKENNVFGQCTLLQKIKLHQLDKFFGEKYRESSFLEHPKVPKHVKTFKAPKFCIWNEGQKNETNCDGKYAHLLYPQDSRKGATRQEIVGWLETYRSHPILHLSCLLRAVALPVYDEEHELDKALEAAIVQFP